MRLMILLMWIAAEMLLSATQKTMAQSATYLQPIATQDDRRTASMLRSSLESQYNNTWNIGSAKKLEGRTYILEVWLTRKGTQWNYQEMLDMQGKINEAVEWLRNTARAYGKQLVIETGTFAGSKYRGIEMEQLPESYAEAASMDQLLPAALRKIGYQSIMHCYETLGSHYNCSNVLVLVMINNNGWSCSNNYSMGHNENGYQNYFLENSYIFKTLKGQPTSAQTIAHEMLHLFGAWDMYEGQASGEAAQWARKNYPNEIMLQINSPLGKLGISPLTAWLTGLSNKFSSWYWQFARCNEAHVDE